MNKWQPIDSVLFHSGQGVQYTCKAPQYSPKEHLLVSNMNKAENCVDNAVTEGLFLAQNQKG